MRAAAFPSVSQAALLTLGDFLLRYVLQLALYDARGSLGLSEEQIGAMAMLLAHGGMIALGMQLQGIGWRGLLHPNPASPTAALALLVPPVLLLVPLALLVDGWMMDGLEALLPLSNWEQEAFSGMAVIDLPTVLSVCVLAPMLEEMLFRGVVLRGFLGHYPPGLAIGYSALLFGAAHLNIYQFCWAFVMGCMAGVLYARSRSLIPCIALHAALNAGATFLGNGGDAAPLSLGTGVLAVLAAAVGALVLHKLLPNPHGPAQTD